jgi:hypothetical protein
MLVITNEIFHMVSVRDFYVVGSKTLTDKSTNYRVVRVLSLDGAHLGTQYS